MARSGDRRGATAPLILALCLSSLLIVTALTMWGSARSASHASERLSLSRYARLVCEAAIDCVAKDMDARLNQVQVGGWSEAVQAGVASGSTGHSELIEPSAILAAVVKDDAKDLEVAIPMVEVTLVSASGGSLPCGLLRFKASATVTTPSKLKVTQTLTQVRPFGFPVAPGLPPGSVVVDRMPLGVTRGSGP